MRCVDGLSTIAIAAAIAAGLTLTGCRDSPRSGARDAVGTFNSDLSFLRQHSEIVVLGDPAGQARVAVAPAYQGRVMTSTTGGADGPSFGWIGRAAIDAGKKQPHMNVFGGEDRFWLGPEGGQYALFFKHGDPFDLEHWQTPEAFDWGPWEVASQSATQISFHKPMALVNYAGTPVNAAVDRTVRLLTAADVASHLGTQPGDAVHIVAFESSNIVTNTGKVRWEPQSGLVSIWILGQFTPSPHATIVIPFVAGSEAAAGPVVNDKYFGAVPPDRLVIRNNTVFFKADGQYRSKIGLSPSRALDLAGSYDAAAHVLTLVQYTHPAGASQYVNSMWELQREPYRGDAINSYNDGPVAPGKPPLGPFYELETSSPALGLGPGEHYTHVHRTMHLSGPEADLDRIARATLKVSLADIGGAFTSH
jgi:uncharacterized protein DUF6786